MAYLNGKKILSIDGLIVQSGGGGGLELVWEGSVEIPKDTYTSIGAQGSVTLEDGKIYAVVLGCIRSEQVFFAKAFVNSNKWGLRFIASFTEENYGTYLMQYIYLYQSNNNAPTIRTNRLLQMSSTGGSYTNATTFYPFIKAIYEVK